MNPKKSILSFNEMTNTIIVTNFFKTGVTRYFIKSSTEIDKEYYRNGAINTHLEKRSNLINL